MKRIVVLVVVMALLSACSSTAVRSPIASPDDNTSFIFMRSISINSKINLLEHGYSVFLRVTSTSPESGTGAVMRYPENGAVISLEPGQSYPLSPPALIPNRKDVVFEVMVLALPSDITVEAINVLSFAIPHFGKAFRAQKTLDALVGNLKGDMSQESRKGLEEGRMVAYYQVPAPDLARTLTIKTAEMEALCDLLDTSKSDAYLLEPYKSDGVQLDGDLPFFMTRLLYDSDLKGKSAWELDLMRNEIFARHGRGFKRRDLQAYFDAQPWYNQQHAPDNFDSALLTPVQRQNTQFILDYQIAHNLR